MDKPNDFVQVIKRLLIGLRDIYFRDVIKASTGYEIINIDGKSKEIIDILGKSLNNSLKEISNSVKKNYVGRSNELSNYLEGVLRNHINNKLKGFKASVPTIKGKKQSAGYPDLIIKCDDKLIYVEVKIYQGKTIESTLRSFYFKPSETNKISASCPHILIGFEVESLGRNNRSPFIIKGFKIVNLYDLKVDLKPEFNTDNPGIYNSGHVIFQST